MLNIKSLVAALVLSGVAALSFAATAEAPAAAASADAMAKPAVKKMKKVKKSTDAVPAAQ